MFYMINMPGDLLTPFYFNFFLISKRTTFHRKSLGFWSDTNKSNKSTIICYLITPALDSLKTKN